MIGNIDVIEEKIASAAKAKKSWGEVALLTMEVERQRLWRSQANTRSFSVWMDSLGSKFSMSKSWIWQAYRAGIHLQEIWPKDESLEAILQQKPEISANALSFLKFLKKSEVNPSFVEAIEGEFLDDMMPVSTLVSLCKEVRHAIEHGLAPIEVFATLHRLDFHALTGHSKCRVVSPAGAGLDALLAFRGSDGPQFMGVRINDFEKPFPTSVDYQLAIVAKGSIIPNDLDEKTGLIMVDCITAQFDLLRAPEITCPDPAEHAALCRHVLSQIL